MLQPQPHWHWFLDQDSQSLALLLEQNKCLRSQLKSSKMIAGCEPQRAFSLEDMQHYMQVATALEYHSLALDSHELSWIAVNAVAIMVWHKPLPLKSWYFLSASSTGVEDGTDPYIASLQTSYDQQDVLVLQVNNGTALCMTLHQPLRLDEHKSLPPLMPIRVLVNRLFPPLSPVQEQEKLA